MTPEAIEELRRLEREAFKAPWTYSEWEIECPSHDSIDDCKNPECDGSHVPCTTIESPAAYPDGQVVAQITCPGLSCLADKQGAFIVAARNALTALLDALESERTIRRELEERLGKAERERDEANEHAQWAVGEKIQEMELRGKLEAAFAELARPLRARTHPKATEETMIWIGAGIGLIVGLTLGFVAGAILGPARPW